MTSIQRTAYPRFAKLTSARMLHMSFTPQSDEIDWARGHTNSPQALLAVLVALKCHQKMARFPAAGEVPDEVVDHVRRCLDLDAEVEPDHGAGRTAKWHRKQIRTRLGVSYDPARARAVAAEAIGEAAQAHNNPPDLINVALDRLVEAGLELPGFSTLDEMAVRIRVEVNTALFTRIAERMGEQGRARLQALVSVAEDGYSMFHRLKKPAQRASWSRFKAKAADFAGEAAAQDADTLSRYESVKRLALVACLVHAARMRARDDLAEMLCKRMASNVKKAKTELEEIRYRQRAVNEHLIGTYRGVLEHLDPATPETAAERAERAAKVVAQAGGFAAQLADIEELRTGDIAVAGPNEYADWTRTPAHLGGMRAPPGGLLRRGRPARHRRRVRGPPAQPAPGRLPALEVGYADNADLVIDDGAPRLKKRCGPGSAQTVERLAAAIEARLPERSLLGIVGRTAQWLGWHHRFGPASGSDPKIADPLGRYALAVFTGGINIGPTEAARHIAGVTARELSMVRNRHIDIAKVNAAIGTVVGAFNDGGRGGLLQDLAVEPCPGRRFGDGTDVPCSRPLRSWPCRMSTSPMTRSPATAASSTSFRWATWNSASA